MKTLVTGGSGFIGSHVVDKLINAGHEVVVLDHRVKPHRDDVEFKDVDIVDYSSVLEATKGCDYIFHLAAMSNVNHVFEKPVYSVELNITGTVNVLEAARQNKCRRVFFASTVWVYTGCNGTYVNENSPFFMPGAGHIYSSSKMACEFFICDYQKLYGVPYTILRYGIPYGPRMRMELVIPIFLKKAFNGEPLTISGDGSQYRNFIYVEDLADAHVLALINEAENQILNLEGMRRITIKEIAETIQKLVDQEVNIEYIPARPGDYEGKEASNDKIKRLLDWEPKVDFKEGMEKTIAWYKSKILKNND
ncbi:MAG: capsular polysaccharide biosynthesis protein [Candidatus Scalindua rubra]|uniref:Capsular polysaccharide biosynthesis protein n=1 Tax=Candidatus Scalindua rubra TaxID=1872076 RepID=A0A1E3X3N5_9BACT|nr:MAG: capsular polysaccharide biosynthesis protein [Candidatus Scalindua rubra]